MLSSISAVDALERLDEFSTIIDARSQSEYALDRLPGAVNWPALTDDERKSIGEQYVRSSAFAAKKRGAALVARNIADHIEREVLDKPKDWRPLVYCWRGGSRSGALALVLDQIGFRVHRLEGGYQRYRNAVLDALDALPPRLDLRVICGSTGSGKSRLLQVLHELGAQVIDLEALANHRGSVLGLAPGTLQPGQRQFESRVWDVLRRFDVTRPVFIESESKKVGDLRVPLALIERMRVSPCVQLDLALQARIALLLEDYPWFVSDTDTFCSRLDALRPTRGNALVNQWQESARAGATPQIVHELLVQHYDPIYLQSMKRNFAGVSKPQLTLRWDGSATSLAHAASQAIAMR
jgi:tRNA 2-selenouridine synthase